MSETEVDVLETLEPSAEVYSVTFAEGTEWEKTYYQTPLTFFGKIELFSVLANAIDKALAEGAVLSEFLEDVPEDVSNLKEADIFVKAILKIVKYSPELLSDIYCISLNVDRSEREQAKIFFSTMSDEQGTEIANRFIDQNWDAMMDFFEKQVSPLVKKVSGKIQSRSESSKPSKATRPRTRKQ